MPLTITIPESEWWDEQNEEFVYTKRQRLVLEHSLVSLSKWESEHHKPFLSKEPMTLQETLDYIRCMTITQNVDPKVYRLIDDATIAKVNSYIEDSMTETWFNEDNKKKGGKSEQITAEIIYYWMTALQIPQEYQKWHLNRLITLIRVCSIKNQPEKKMSQAETIARHRELNAIRRKQRKMKK